MESDLATFCRELNAAFGYSGGGPMAPVELIDEAKELRQLCDRLETRLVHAEKVMDALRLIRRALKRGAGSASGDE